MGSRVNRAAIKSLNETVNLNKLPILFFTTMFPFSLGVGLDRQTHCEG